MKGRNKTAEERIINLDDPKDVKRWCSELRCNEMRLRNAVRAVGPSAEAVKRYMNSQF